MPASLTTKEFIQKAIEIHGNKYDYSKVNYLNHKSKIKIICPIHGEFLQQPKNHIYKKHGCSKCGHKSSSCKQSLTTKQFIQKARKIHGNKYDYNKTKYINNHIKLIVICSKHGKFLQQPEAHLRGQGCIKCFRENQKSSLKEFINKSQKIHRDKYDYSKVKYINAHAKVIIICPKHGKFLQKPGDHLNQKQGCPSCAGIKKLTTKEFIQKAKLIHGNRYNYNLVKYINNRTKVIIICKKHGKFLQKPGDHIVSKAGCPYCKKSKGELSVLKILKNYKIKYISQKTFIDCRNPKTNFSLKYDFYLPKYNILIEYNGQQHYEKYKRFFNNKGGNKKFKLQQYRDSLKKQYALSHGYKFLVIKYNDNIEQSLRNAINPFVDTTITTKQQPSSTLNS